ncbi:MAG TPA: hypothetical protein VG651_07065 [Stellaceae bacterium]|nr:hypothetical protein [Stellaceae bacterium]
MLKVLRFLNLLLVVLVFGLTWAHVMEIYGKLRLNGAQWLDVQHNLYVAFGWPVGACIEIAAIVSTWGLVFATRRRRPAFAWAVAAGVCVTLGLAVWFWLVAPMNGVIAGARTPPADWTAIRNQWEIGQAVHCVLYGLGFGFLLEGLLAETPR